MPAMQAALRDRQHRDRSRLDAGSVVRGGRTSVDSSALLEFIALPTEQIVGYRRKKRLG